MKKQPDLPEFREPTEHELSRSVFWKDAVKSYCGRPADDVFTQKRGHEYSGRKWMGYYLLRKRGRSFVEIAKMCDVDHTSAMYGLDQIYNVKGGAKSKYYKNTVPEPQNYYDMRYNFLLELQEQGRITALQRGVKLLICGPVEFPHGRTSRPIYFDIDFGYQKDGEWVYECLRARLHDNFELKRAIMMSGHGIEVRRVELSGLTNEI